MTTNSAAGGSETPARRRKRRFTFDKVSFFVCFLGVPLAIYTVFVVSPFVQAFYFSLVDWNGFSGDQTFVGLGNYERLFQDPLFLKAMGNNIVLAIALPLITITLALVLATLVTVGGASHGQIRGIKGGGVYRVVSFFPYVIPGVVIGIIWGAMLDPSSGLIPGFMKGLLDVDYWDGHLGNPDTAMWWAVFVIVWAFVGFYMLLFIAAIKGIPAEIFEAVRLDGAGRLRTAISITIPMIRDNIQTAYIYIGIVALDAFVYMASLFPGSSPNNSTLVMSQQLFVEAFRKGRFGYASAMGVVLAVMTLLFAGIVFGVNRLLGGKDSGALE